MAAIAYARKEFTLSREATRWYHSNCLYGVGQFFCIAIGVMTCRHNFAMHSDWLFRIEPLLIPIIFAGIWRASFRLHTFLLELTIDVDPVKKEKVFRMFHEIGYSTVILMILVFLFSMNLK